MTIEDRLRERMLQVIRGADLERNRALIRQMAVELDIDFLDCAAALIQLYQARYKKNFSPKQQDNTLAISSEVTLSNTPKMVRYRLEVGRKHSVSKDDIKDALVEESGVERKMIGFIEMHHLYTLIELPEGMPHDIFHHLKSVEIKQQKLHIKRIGIAQGKKRNSMIRRGKHRTSLVNKPNSVVDAPK